MKTVMRAGLVALALAAAAAGCAGSSDSCTNYYNNFCVKKIRCGKETDFDRCMSGINMNVNRSASQCEQAIKDMEKQGCSYFN